MEWIDAETKPPCQKPVLIAYTDHRGTRAVTVGWYTPSKTLESGMLEGGE